MQPLPYGSGPADDGWVVMPFDFGEHHGSMGDAPKPAAKPTPLTG